MEKLIETQAQFIEKQSEMIKELQSNLNQYATDFQEQQEWNKRCHAAIKADRESNYKINTFKKFTDYCDEERRRNPEKRKNEINWAAYDMPMDNKLLAYYESRIEKLKKEYEKIAENEKLTGASDCK